ncbi:hypothetical protein ABTY61_03005 [Kitasatospora sp. NPDC096128]|uniref:hypothetical protein n=1 Tax=Kitasatospora sp. NPDC096128 TaxID=3155547 RepID=UPI003326A222
MPATRLPSSLRLRWTLGLASALAVVGAAVLLFLLGMDDSGDARPVPVPPSNIAGRRTACLTGDTTEAGGRTDTGAIWAALQDAARQRPLNVQQLFAPATTGEQALPYLAGLSAQHCDLVVAVGPAFGQSLATAAQASPRTTFVAVTTDGQAAPAGVDAVSGDDTRKAAEVHSLALALAASER